GILLSVGAGTGLIFILRWFWWRISAYTEIAGMLASVSIALVFYFIKPDWPAWVVMVVSIAATTICWVTVTMLTPPTSPATLARFYTLIRPFGRGWKKFAPDYNPKNNQGFGGQILCMFIGSISVYTALFAVGLYLYGNMVACLACAVVAVAGGWLLLRMWNVVKQ
ncbi:MAG: Na+:solute symporter, partial [Flavobacteriales bacterium]|nr:Na+:solute symporter [Flavobacteriales bacterium]